MLKTIQRFIEHNKMIEPHDTVVVGLSGGADSVCLLLILKELQKNIDFTMIAVHINHCIRGEEADRDQEFARNLCKREEIQFMAFAVEVEKIAKDEKISVEEAGRKTRYRIFNEVLNGSRGKIAVAHHMDDQGETILMNILRGSGIKGICGMKPIRDTIIRPLLCVRRHEIESYLIQRGQNYQIDSSNLDNEYTRNRLRNMIFPYFEENINAQSVENICRMAEVVTEAESYIEKQAAEAATECVKVYDDKLYNEQVYVIDLDSFTPNDIIIKKYIIKKIIGQLAGHLKDVYKVHIESVLELENKQVGSQIDLAYKILAKRGYHEITLMNKTIQKEKVSNNIEIIFPEGKEKSAVSIKGEYYCKDGELICLQMAEFEKIFENQKIMGNDYTKVFDYDKIKFTLRFRTRQTGDYIQIDEKGGNKKLKDFFIDQKVPRDYRDRVLLLADGSHILWIVGYRMSEGYKITSKTKCVLRMNLY